MKIRFLGTGTSTGVPEIGCKCDVCTSSDFRDRRLRASVLLQTAGKNILLDCGPDFRQQALDAGLEHLDALLVTHEHYDHVGGIDDLRPFCKHDKFRIFSEGFVAQKLRERMPYCFVDTLYPGVPQLELVEIGNTPFYAAETLFIPIRLMHYKLPVFGYRTGSFAYLTDFKDIPEEEYDKLTGLDVLIIDALRQKEHISHISMRQALTQIERIHPKRAYFIHMSHGFGLHQKIAPRLPENVFLPYDGLEIEC